MADLKKKGSEKMRKMYARHGMATERVFGVSVADLKIIAKTIIRTTGSRLRALRNGQPGCDVSGRYGGRRLANEQQAVEWMG
jgi:hypothetical protein